MTAATENRMRVARGRYGPRPSMYRRRDFRMPKEPRHTPTEVEARRIAVEVAGRMGLSLDEIRSASRSAEVLAARRLIAALSRSAGASLPEIGRVINRDHSTVLHGLRRFDTAQTPERAA